VVGWSGWVKEEESEGREKEIGEGRDDGENEKVNPPSSATARKRKKK